MNVHINVSITHCICMKYTSIFAIIVLFKIRSVCSHSDAPMSHYICRNLSSSFSIIAYIPNTGIFPNNWFDKYSASWVHRDNDHNLLHIIYKSPNPMETTRVAVICKYLFSKSKIIFCIKQQFWHYNKYNWIWLIRVRIIEFLLYCLYILISIQVILLSYF